MIRDNGFRLIARSNDMIPIKQEDSKSCLRTAIASLMELPLEEVPDFIEIHKEDWYEGLQKWLNSGGYSCIALAEPTDHGQIPAQRITLIEKKNGKDHALVRVDEDLYWDPGSGSFKKNTDRVTCEMFVVPNFFKRRDGVVDQQTFKKKVHGWKASGLRVVFTNGVFDLMHAGHVKLLQGAIDWGHRLVVAVNSDASVKRIKGEARPIIPEKDRCNMVAAIHGVDLVTTFDEDTPLEIITACIPNVLVKGSDWRGNVVGSDVVKNAGGHVVLVDRVEDMLSTTEILDKIRRISEK